MPKASFSHYCQKCCAANPFGQEFCQRCGTRLMIVVQPPSVRVDSIETTPHEEHLLERLTILENTLARLAERLEQGLKLLLRQSETSFTNHALVKSLIEMLNECGAVDQAHLESKWRAECDKLHGSEEPRSNLVQEPKTGRKAKRKSTASE